MFSESINLKSKNQLKPNGFAPLPIAIGIGRGGRGRGRYFYKVRSRLQVEKILVEWW